MSDLLTYTDEELQQELERRKEEEEERKRPKLIENPDWSNVISGCAKYVCQVANLGQTDDDLEVQIFEDALCAVFGHDVFDWINLRVR